MKNPMMKWQAVLHTDEDGADEYDVVAQFAEKEDAESWLNDCQYNMDFIEILPVGSYSDIIKMQDGKYMRHCPTCKQSYTIWKCHFPVLMLRALRVLQDAGKPMQVREIQKELKTNWDERGKFKRLKHWKLITENEDGACIPTDDVPMLFGGVKRVREWLWIFHDQVVEPPMDEKNGDLKHISELHHRLIPLQDIIGDSVSAFASTPVPSEQSALL